MIKSRFLSLYLGLSISSYILEQCPSSCSCNVSLQHHAAMHHHSNDIIQVMYGAWFSLELDIQAKKTIFISDKKFFSHQVETAHGGLSIVQQVCVLHAFYKLYFY